MVMFHLLMLGECVGSILEKVKSQDLVYRAPPPKNKKIKKWDLQNANQHPTENLDVLSMLSDLRLSHFSPAEGSLTIPAHAFC